MEKYTDADYESLLKRVQVLEEKLKYLGDFLCKLGVDINKAANETVPTDVCFSNDDVKSDNKQPLVINLDDEEKVDDIDNTKNVVNIADEIKVTADNSVIDEEKVIDEATEKIESVEDEYGSAVKSFMAKYSAGEKSYDLILQIGKSLVKELSYVTSWQGVNDNIKNKIYLEEAYDSRMYYVDCVQIEDDFVYMAAPVESDHRLSELDFVKLALPHFYKIEYSHDLQGKNLELKTPALFTMDDMGRFVVKQQGEVVLLF